MKMHPVLIALVAILGFGTVGAIFDPEPKVVTKTVEVEKIVEKPVEVIKHVEVEVPVEKIVEKKIEVTPKVCLKALDLAAEGFEYAAQFTKASADGFDAISRSDLAGMKQAARDMAAANAKLDAHAQPVGVATQACRATAAS